MSKRQSGVLMHVTSLPGRFAVGGFGEEAKRFIDFLSETGFKIWQVLPFHPIDEMNSPYKSESAFAGNFLFIDPQTLLNEGIVSQSDVDECVYHGSPYTADYAFASGRKKALLRKAFEQSFARFKDEITAFKSAHPWAENYALFKACKNDSDDAPWWEWEKSLRDFNACVSQKERFENEMNYYIFVQYLFFEQWKTIKDYAAAKGVKILGDMPVYVSMDSADVWSDVGNFLIDEQTFVPDEVAGVPPDYFSKEGQLWGNPIYNWQKMEQNGFSWWKERVAAELELYDMLRIDHFRGLASYWAVPSGSKTAVNGKWKQGPGMSLFNALKDTYSGKEIIAEDLGAFGEDVKELLKETGFPGIRVIQFAFQSNGENEHLPHNYSKNTVACLGTHDNNTLLGWLYELSEGERGYTLDYCGFGSGDGDWGTGGYNAPACRKIIETVWRSSADTAIIAFQDLCGFGSDARMNIPGVPELNWRIRTTQETIDSADKSYFRKINAIFGR